MSTNSETQPTTNTATVVVRVVVLPKHLHARPAGQLAQLAAQHQPTTIELATSNRQANARSVLAVMALGAITGSQLHIQVTGPNAATIADNVVEILQSPETG
jgi:phosphotransferase system HPr (HPr) family protein